MEIVENKMLVTGGSGILGQQLQKELPNALFPHHALLDVTKSNDIYRYLVDNKVEQIIHCAALKVGNDDFSLLNTNIVGTCNLVKYCSLFKIKMIYISTDYVFDGKRGNYSEEDAPKPIMKYGFSKLGGECAVQMLDNFLILRVAFFPDGEFPYDKALIDQYNSKIKASTLAKIIKKLVYKDVSGILHVGGKTKTNYDFAKMTSTKKIKELTLAEVNAKIPVDCSLNTSKLKKILNEEYE